MFSPRDQNRLSAAPSVKIPTLSTPNGGVTRGGAYAPSLSLRRRFGPTPQLPLSEVHEVVAEVQRLPVAELDVHECDVPVATVESPTSQDGITEATERRMCNEMEKVEDVTALVESPHNPVDVIGGAKTQQAEFLLQKDEFLERLVSRVRASCANVTTDGDDEVEDAEKRTHCSPPPRRPSPAAEWRNRIDEVEAVAPRGRAPSPSRSRSPSPLSSPSITQRAAVSALADRSCAVVKVQVSPPNSPVASRSGATSPDARAPSTDLFAAGGALRSSLQYSRCSGVSRGRRSLSAERPEATDEENSNADGCEGRGGDTFWIRAEAATARRTSSLSSECVTVSASHPQWVPRPVPQARPAWNQRQPPKKQRPIVSAPGSNPPPSTRRSISRSPERARMLPPSSPSDRFHKAFLTGEPHHSAERAFRRSASLPATQQPVQPQIHTQERFSATAPRPAAVAASGRRSSDDAQVLTTQSPIDGGDATTSPSSPPSARALFQSIDVDSATRTTDPVCRDSPLSAQAMQQACDTAMARATRAEQQCSVLTLALEQLLVEHAEEKAAWQARFAALEQQMRVVTQWINSVDAEAGVSKEQPRSLASSVQPTDDAMGAIVASHTQSAESAKPPLFTRVMTGKTAVWDEEEDVDVSSHPGSIHGSSRGRSAGSSPLPGAPGATPTPARRDSASGESRGTSACQARLPPSPPIILHLHTQQ